MRDRRRRRRQLEGTHATEAGSLDAGTRQPHHGALAPNPRPFEPARRLELRNMPPNHTLIEIKPNLHRPQRHHSEPSDEPSDPQRSRTQERPPTHHRLTTQGCPGPTAVRPASTDTEPRSRLAADYPNHIHLCLHVGGG
jgi:hypothetical protein